MILLVPILLPKQRYEVRWARVCLEGYYIHSLKGSLYREPFSHSSHNKAAGSGCATGRRVQSGWGGIKYGMSSLTLLVTYYLDNISVTDHYCGCNCKGESNNYKPQL